MNTTNSNDNGNGNEKKFTQKTNPIAWVGNIFVGKSQDFNYDDAIYRCGESKKGNIFVEIEGKAIPLDSVVLPSHFIEKIREEMTGAFERYEEEKAKFEKTGHGGC